MVSYIFHEIHVFYISICNLCALKREMHIYAKTALKENLSLKSFILQCITHGLSEVLKIITKIKYCNHIFDKY